MIREKVDAIAWQKGIHQDRRWLDLEREVDKEALSENSKPEGKGGGV